MFLEGGINSEGGVKSGESRGDIVFNTDLVMGRRRLHFVVGLHEVVYTSMSRERDCG